MKENFADWEFLMEGNHNLLRQQSETTGTEYCEIGGGIDHWLDCRNEDFRMTSLYTQDEEDPYTVWQVGYELVGLLNGANALFSREPWRLKIHGLLHKGREARYEPIEGSAALLGRPAFPQARIEENLARARKQSIEFVLLHLATENQDVYFILKYLNMEAGWVTYYKLMEAVEQFAADKSIDLKADQKARKSFTNTANNFSLSGFDSRHGFKQAAKQNKTASMTLEQAHSFVTSMAKSFLKQAYFPAAPSATAS